MLEDDRPNETIDSTEVIATLGADSTSLESADSKHESKDKDKKSSSSKHSKRDKEKERRSSKEKTSRYLLLLLSKILLFFFVFIFSNIFFSGFVRVLESVSLV